MLTYLELVCHNYDHHHAQIPEITTQCKSHHRTLQSSIYHNIHSITCTPLTVLHCACAHAHAHTHAHTHTHTHTHTYKHISMYTHYHHYHHNQHHIYMHVMKAGLIHVRKEERGGRRGQPWFSKKMLGREGVSIKQKLTD